MKNISFFALGVLFLTCLSCGNVPCELDVAEPFTDGMILPKDKPVRVFGSGSGRIRISFGGNIKKCMARNGKWCAELPAMKAGGPYEMKICCKGAEKEVTVSDIYVGTVIMLAGQSNLQFKLKESSTPVEDWKGDPLLRSFSLPRLEAGEPYSPADGWVKCTDSNAGDFSAIGYHTGIELRRRTGEAVGLVNCYQGASAIEAWMPEEAAQKPQYQLPDTCRHIDHFYKQYDWNSPGTLYTLDIVPFAPYPVSAVLWYQGESNTGLEEYKIYPSMFADMVSAWRSDFKDESLPFAVVEIADMKGRGEPWKNFQKAQETIPEHVGGTTVVKSADVCDSTHIHPADKRALSIRIADSLMVHLN